MRGSEPQTLESWASAKYQEKEYWGQNREQESGCRLLQIDLGVWQDGDLEKKIMDECDTFRD